MAAKCIETCTSPRFPPPPAHAPPEGKPHQISSAVLSRKHVARLSQQSVSQSLTQNLESAACSPRRHASQEGQVEFSDTIWREQFAHPCLGLYGISRQDLRISPFSVTRLDALRTLKTEYPQQEVKLHHITLHAKTRRVKQSSQS